METSNFKSRLKELIDERFNGNKKAFVEAFNEYKDGKYHITGSSMSGIMNGSREPSYTTVVGIAQFFDVSMDYLCGLSDSRTSDYESVNVAKHTGLDADAIEALHILNNESHFFYKTYSRLISFLIIDMYDSSYLTNIMSDTERMIGHDAIIPVIYDMLNNIVVQDEKTDGSLPHPDEYFIVNEYDVYEYAYSPHELGHELDSIAKINKEDLIKLLLMKAVQEIYNKQGQYQEWIEKQNKSTPRKRPRNEKPIIKQAYRYDDELPFS